MTTPTEIGFDVVVLPREREVVQAFRCVICERGIEDDRWSIRQSFNAPPICGACTQHWGDRSPTIRRGMTRGDFIVLRGRKGIIERLNWEIHNGVGRSQYF